MKFVNLVTIFECFGVIQVQQFLLVNHLYVCLDYVKLATHHMVIGAVEVRMVDIKSSLQGTDLAYSLVH